jgi:TRAP transporter 4TM/12TM fusion protein
MPISPDKEEQSISGRTNKRKLKGIAGKFVFGYAAAIAFYHILYVMGFFPMVGIYILPQAHYATSLGTLTILVFLVRPIKEGKSLNHIPWYDVLFIAGAAVSLGYPAIFVEHLTDVAAKGVVGTTEIVLFLIALVVMLEASRRVIGLVMPALVVFFLLHAMYCNYFPGVLAGRGFSLGRIVFLQYATLQGLWGSAMAVGATVIITFVTFAYFLQRSGAGEFFLNLALGSVGRFTGGPAKAAVLGSALFGTFTGSPSANVVGTGVVTIPLMKKCGYSPEFAGGVEAAASTGAQFVPPVMGAVAFIMSDWLGIPYINICFYALGSAILYYVAVFMQVHLRAVKDGLTPVRGAEMPSARKALKEGWYFILPVIAIILLMALLNYRPEIAGVYAMGIAVLLSMVKKETRMGPKAIMGCLQSGSLGMLNVIMSCGLAGLLIGAFVITGVGYKLSSALVALCGGSLPLLLLFAGVAAYILGMGLPSIPLYIVVVTLIAPALTTTGVSPVSAHLFVFYWAMISFITPPVALAAYTASAIADSDPFKTGMASMRLGIVACIIPFAFVYDNALLLIGAPGQIVLSLLSATVGVALWAYGAEGYMMLRVTWWQRILLLTGGSLLLFRMWWFDIFGLVVAAPVFLRQLQQSRVINLAARARSPAS